jgi:hypothetical protein
MNSLCNNKSSGEVEVTALKFCPIFEIHGFGSGPQAQMAIETQHTAIY